MASSPGVLDLAGLRTIAAGPSLAQMRVLISAVANEHFGERIAAVDPSVERVVMGADGTIRDLAGTPIDPDLPIEVAWGSADIFVEGGPARPFFGFIRSASSLRWFQSPAAGLDHP